MAAGARAKFRQLLLLAMKLNALLHLFTLTGEAERESQRDDAQAESGGLNQVLRHPQLKGPEIIR